MYFLRNSSPMGCTIKLTIGTVGERTANARGIGRLYFVTAVHCIEEKTRLKVVKAYH